MSDFTVLICILVAPIIALLVAIIAQRKIHNKPQKERRKGLLILLGIFVFVVLLLIITGGGICRDWEDYVRFLKETFLVRGFIGLTILVIVFFFYGYFRKNKKNSQRKTKLD